jgi:hypothetical protein
MLFILDIILNIVMTVLSLVPIVLGIAIWWTANIFFVKLFVSIYCMLVGIAIMCLAVMSWSNL